MREHKHCAFPTLTETPFFCLPESIGWYANWPAHSVTRNVGALNNFSIHLITSGSGYVEIDGQSFLLQAGDAFLYFPLMQQRYYSNPSDPWDVKWVHFYGGPTLAAYLTEQGLRRSILWTVRPWNDLERTILRLLDEAERNSMLRMPKLSALTYAVLSEFIGRAEPFTLHKGIESSERIAKLLPAIQAHAHEPFELDTWAETAGVSTSYFCKLFRKTTTMTPIEFVTLCRLQRAKQLLLEQPDWPVKRIAEEAGYVNTSYFNKRFLAQEQMTPMTYRRLRLGWDSSSVSP